MHRLALLAALALSVPALAKQSGSDAADTKAMHDFKLTPGFVDKLTAASAAMNTAYAKLSPSERKTLMSGDKDSLADKARSIEKNPAALSAVKGAGLTPREYVVGSMVLLTSGMFAQMDTGEKLPPEVNPDNVKFVKTHQEQVGKWGAVVQQGMDAQHKKNAQDREKADADADQDEK